MAQVRIGRMAAHLGADHVEAGIPVFGYGRLFDGLREAGPAAAGIELVLRAEQRLATHHVHIDAGREQVVVLVREGALGAGLLRHPILLGRELRFQVGIGRFLVGSRIKTLVCRIACIRPHAGLCRIASLFAGQRLVGLAHIDMAVAVGVFHQVVLMVFLGVIEVLERLVFHHQWAAVFFLLGFQRTLDDGLLGRVRVVHAGTVLRTAVIALLVQAGRVDDAEIVLQDIVQAQTVGIVGHLHRFGMAGATDYVLVTGVSGVAVGVARHGIHHTRNTLKIRFHAPEAATGQIDGFGVHDFVRFLGVGLIVGLRRRRQTGDIGLFGIVDDGQRLRLGDAAADDAHHGPVFIQHHPGRIDLHAQLPRQQTTIVHQHRHVRIVPDEGRIPGGELTGRLFAQKAGRGQRDQIGAGKALVGRPGIGVGQLGQTQRAPAGPELHQRGPARLDVGRSRLALHVLQFGQIGQRRTLEPRRQLAARLVGTLARRTGRPQRQRTAARTGQAAEKGHEHQHQQHHQKQVSGGEQSLHDLLP